MPKNKHNKSFKRTAYLSLSNSTSKASFGFSRSSRFGDRVYIFFVLSFNLIDHLRNYLRVLRLGK